MESFKDLFTPFYERLRRPFIGAYSIAWFFLNWKLWTALFFYKEVVNGVDKITFIQIQLGHSNTWLGPLKYSCIFLLVTPLLDLAVFTWQDWFRSLKRKIQLYFENVTPVKPETHRRLIQEKQEIEVKYTEIAATVQKYKDENSTLLQENRIFRRSNLNVNAAFFHGDWSVEFPNKTDIKLRITTDNRITLVKLENETVVQNISVYNGLRWLNDGRVIRLLLTKSNPDERKVIDSWINVQLKDDTYKEYKSLLLSNSPCIYFNIDELQNNYIRPHLENGGGILNFVRQDKTRIIPVLWENDDKNEFTLR